MRVPLFILMFFSMSLAASADETPSLLKPFPSLYKAQAIDPLGNKDWRPNEKGAIRTAIGLQIMSKCIHSMEETPEQAILNINAWLEEVTSRALSCREKYPELDHYLLGFISNLRRSIVECQAVRKDQGGHQNPIRRTITLSQPSIGHIPHELFHEILHETDADNYVFWDHNTHEKEAPEKNGACGKDSTTDRVSVIDSICSGTNLNASENNATLDLAERMERCGPEAGCEDIFTKSNFFLFNFFGNLSEDKARSLCQKIKEEGLCRKEALKSFEADLTPVKILDKLRSRLDSVLPKSNTRIPSGLISVFPEIKEGYAALKNSRCFRAVFSEDYEGNLYAATADSKAISKNGKNINRMDKDGHTYFWVGEIPPEFIVKDLADWIGSPEWKAPSICSEGDITGLRAWIGGLQDRLSERSDVSRKLAVIISDQLLVKNISWSMVTDWLDSINGIYSSSMTQLLGKDLFNEYMKEVIARYPSSKDFVCPRELRIPAQLQELPEVIQDVSRPESCFE